MKKIIFLLMIALSSCSNALYVKNTYFDCAKVVYKMDTDLKELIYQSLQRATVTEKDIADYRLMKDKNRIYVLNSYQADDTAFNTKEEWENNLSFLQAEDIPNKIQAVRYCLKSKEELQAIADQTKEDFLAISFGLIKIDGDKATIRMNNTWRISKHNTDNLYMSGGGYTCVYEKKNGTWVFSGIVSSWIS